MKISPCRKCGAPIGFIKSKTERFIPVDAGSKAQFVLDPKATYVAVLEDGTVGKARLAQEFEASFVGYTSHFATCPAADEFRRPR